MARAPVPPATLAPVVPPTMRGPRGPSSRRALFAAVGVGTALGLIALFVGTAVFDSGDGQVTNTRTGSAPEGSAEGAGPGTTATPTQLPLEPVTAAVDPTPEPVVETPAPAIATPLPVVATPEPVVATPLPDVATPEPVVATAAPAAATPVAIAIDEPQDVSEPAPASTPEPTAALVLERVDRTEVLTPRDLEPIEPAPDGRVNRVNTWVCEGDLTVEGPRNSTWDIDRVNFQILGEKERLIIQLNRVGPGNDQPITVTAQSFDTEAIRKFVPGATRPEWGRNTVGLLLRNGIGDDLHLRGYQPSGMRLVKEFSSYDAPGASARLVTSVAAPGCFRLQIPAWTGPNARNVKRARIILDVRR